MAVIDSTPKYAQLELERRWLVPRAQLPAVEQLVPRLIDDRYLDGGRLRLRRVLAAAGETLFKLGKKYEARPGQSEYVVSVYLTAHEYAALAQLPGYAVRKRRYAFAGGSLDIYEQPEHEFSIFEVEFGSLEEMSGYVPPAFVDQEVTFNASFSGHALAKNAL